MVSVSVAAILAIVAQLALWGLLLAFGIWVYRRLKLRSLPWLGVYLALSVVLSFGTPLLKMHIFDAVALRHAADPFVWSLGEFAATWTYLEALGANLVKVIVALLVLADIAFLLEWKKLPIDSDPEDPGKREISHDAVYYHFRKWSKDGSLKQVWAHSIDVIKDRLDVSELSLDGSHTIAKKGGSQ